MTSQLDQWKQISGSVDSGELWLEPGVAKQCADRCQRHVEELTVLHDRLEFLGRVDGYGDLPSGQQLGEKFRQMATGGGPYYDLKSLLKDRMAVATQMRDTFNRIHDKYQDAERDNVGAIRRAGAGS